MFRRFANLATFAAFLLTSALPIQASGSQERLPDLSEEGAGASQSTSSAATPAPIAENPDQISRLGYALGYFPLTLMNLSSNAMGINSGSHTQSIAIIGAPDPIKTELSNLMRTDVSQVFTIARDPSDARRMKAIDVLWYPFTRSKRMYQKELAPMLLEMVHNPQERGREKIISYLWRSALDEQEDLRQQLFPLTLALSDDLLTRIYAREFLSGQGDNPAAQILKKKLESGDPDAALIFDTGDVTPEVLQRMIDEYLYPAFVANGGTISYLSPEMLHGLGLMREEEQLKKEKESVEQRLGYLTEAYPQTETATDSSAAAATAVDAVPEHPLALLMLSGVVLEETMLRHKIAQAKFNEALDSLSKDRPLAAAAPQ